MNYLAHALPFLDDPYFVAGTAVPDWLSVVDRRVRVRRKHALPFVAEQDCRTAAVARGILQHHRDDRRFHQTRAFAELSLELSGLVRKVLGSEAGFRTAFLGHLLVEVLLDAAVIAESPEKLADYYEILEGVDAAAVQAAVNRMGPRGTDRLAALIVAFRQHRILSDYAQDAKLFARLNQVMRRVGLDPLPQRFRQVLPEARRRVAPRKDVLLDGIPVEAIEAIRKP